MSELTLLTISLISGAFIVSWSGVGIFRQWSLRRELLDIPNERSSHSIPTPRGGGAVIALSGIVGYVLIGWFLETSLSYGYLIAAGLVAAVSWFDDLYSLPFWARLFVHIVASVLLVTDTGVWNHLSVPYTEAEVALGNVIGGLLTVLWIVWLLNAYNFMDGIDGIAGLQAIITSVAWSVFAVTMGLRGTAAFAGLLGAISLGFLIHNWQPARIFMGDVGSAFLGFTIAALPLLARNEAGIEIAVLPILGVLFVWPFVFDTVFTFGRRASKGERVWEAHRSHLYQRMVIRGMSHQKVTTIYGLSAVFVCLGAFCALEFAGIYTALAILSIVSVSGLLLALGLRHSR